jgi:hypothetical protein
MVFSGYCDEVIRRLGKHVLRAGS